MPSGSTRCQSGRPESERQAETHQDQALPEDQAHDRTGADAERRRVAVGPHHHVECAAVVLVLRERHVTLRAGGDGRIALAHVPDDARQGRAAPLHTTARRLFAQVAGRHEHEAQTKEVAIRIHIEPQADQLDADPDRIEQAIENLVANALRHTPAGGTITLRATQAGGLATLSVSDTFTVVLPQSG